MTLPTREEILGADLDRLCHHVAQHVMLHRLPFRPHQVPCPEGKPGCAVLHTDLFDAEGIRLPDYASAIEPAWRVLDWLKKRYGSISLCADGGWSLTAWEQPASGPATRLVGPVHAATAPEAICRAALLALLEE